MQPVRKLPFQYRCYPRLRRALSDQQYQFLHQQWPAYALANTPLACDGYLDLRQVFPNRARITTRVALEIGYGDGERLLFQLQNDSVTCWLAAEPYPRGILSLLTGAITLAPAVQASKRLRLITNIEPQLSLLPDNSLAQIDIFFPDPWPKRRHQKRRVVQAASLRQFHRILLKGSAGKLRIMTDSENYYRWVAALVNGDAAWKIVSITPPPELTATPSKYQRKAESRRTKCYYLQLQPMPQ